MKKSFNLIEVTISILIFAIISGEMFVIFHEGYKLARQSEGKSLAYNLAREKIEELLEDPGLFVANPACVRPGSCPLTDPVSNPFCPCQPSSLVQPPDEVREVVPGFYPLNDSREVYREVDIVNPYDGINELAYIAVTVWWDNKRGHETFETLKANY